MCYDKFDTTPRARRRRSGPEVHRFGLTADARDVYIYICTVDYR